jgi:hypothetical protein
MDFDPGSERLLSLKESAGYFPSYRKGKPATAERVRRAMQSGRLEACKVGNQWVTTVSAIRRYIARCTAEAEAERRSGRAPERLGV